MLRAEQGRRAARRLQGLLEGVSASDIAFPPQRYRRFTRDNFDREWLAAQAAPIVVKASGLAAGKGVIIAATAAEAVDAAESMLAGRFGSAGEEIVIEEFLEGEEASFIVICDGVHALPMASSQDHKRLRDGDEGPNTGGMGAYSPAPVVTSMVHERVMNEVIEPTLKGLAADGMPFVGFLYAGLMIDAAGRAPGHRIQRAIRRSGDAAGPGATQVRSHRAVRGGAGRHPRQRAGPSGIRAPRSAW